MSKCKIILPGILLSFFLNVNSALAADYTVVSGDSLWKISQKYNVSITKIVELNNLKSDSLAVGQVLHLDAPATAAQSVTTNKVVTANQTAWLPITNPPVQKTTPTTTVANRPNSTSYIVKPGDTLGNIGQKFGVSVADLRSLNNIQGDLIYAGQTLALSGTGTVSRGEVNRSANTTNATTAVDQSTARYGQLVDWFKEGINILKPATVFTATDSQTGKTIKLRVLGGSNHCDVEPLTKDDTATMLSLFGAWTWTPRPVCLHVDGKDIAASLSGMPHTTIEDVKDNDVTGHFDMYLLNSKPHGTGVSQAYVQQHYEAVQKAASK